MCDFCAATDKPCHALSIQTRDFICECGRQSCAIHRAGHTVLIYNRSGGLIGPASESSESPRHFVLTCPCTPCKCGAMTNFKLKCQRCGGIFCFLKRRGSIKGNNNGGGYQPMPSAPLIHQCACQC